MSNLFSHIPSNLPAELMETLIQSDGVRVERIVSHGHASPEGFWYDQDEHEWVMVLQGSARLQLEDRTIDLGPGDYINLPAHTKHRVQWATNDQPTIWLAIFYKSLAFPAFDIPVSNE
jgi:cupin 2 domain-containing protein